VRLLGYVPDAGQAVGSYRLFVHAARQEPFGLAIVEAMASGVPVIAAPVGVCRQCSRMGWRVATGTSPTQTGRQRL
jgi:glycosyltransferase involved in cell wall biosynthesis